MSASFSIGEMVVVGIVIDRKKGFVKREVFKFGGNEKQWLGGLARSRKVMLGELMGAYTAEAVSSIQQILPCRVVNSANDVCNFRRKTPISCGCLSGIVLRRYVET
jgi:hypothetical protein